MASYYVVNGSLSAAVFLILSRLFRQIPCGHGSVHGAANLLQMVRFTVKSLLKKEILKKAYDSEYVITFDELPDLY